VPVGVSGGAAGAMRVVAPCGACLARRGNAARVVGLGAVRVDSGPAVGGVVGWDWVKRAGGIGGVDGRLLACGWAHAWRCFRWG
jgi:hypothetical protein